MSHLDTLLRLHDLDQLLRELSDPESRDRLHRMGFPDADPAGGTRHRERLLAALDPRWQSHYQRAHGRYGRGLTAVRGRACQGCFMTLATAAAPSGGEPISVCESCGRLLYWR